MNPECDTELHERRVFRAVLSRKLRGSQVDNAEALRRWSRCFKLQGMKADVVRKLSSSSWDMLPWEAKSD
eukprot:755574-Hanusia_phi.AAC.2